MRNLAEMRFPVQYVIRPDLHFRGYAGQVASGIVRPGDTVKVLPSGWTTRVKSIVTWDGELPQAFTPMSVTLCLEDELDISRGDMLVAAGAPPLGVQPPGSHGGMDEPKAAPADRPYLVKHTTQQVRGRVREIRHRVDVNTLRHEPAAELRLNEIGVVELETHRPLFFDPYRQNRATGSFILIDEMTNCTVAAGMITAREPGPRKLSDDASLTSSGGHQVSPADHESRSGHRAVTLWLDGGAETAYQLERRLFNDGMRVHAIPGSASAAEICRALNDAGVIAVVYGSTDSEARETLADRLGPYRFFHMSDAGTVDRILDRLRREGIVAGISSGD